MRVVVGAVLVSLIVGVAPASAGVIEEIAAGDAVEAKLEKRDHRYSFTASCRQLSKKRFTCKFAGFRSHAVVDGRATVRRVSALTYRATITSFHTTKF